MVPPVCMLQSALYPQNFGMQPQCISHPGFLLVLFSGLRIALPAQCLAASLARRCNAGTEILSWNLQSTITQQSQQEDMSTNSVLETRFTRALMVNSWSPWLAEEPEGCQSMEHFEFIQRLLYSIFAREAIIDSPHVVLTLSMDKRF